MDTPSRNDESYESSDYENKSDLQDDEIDDNEKTSVDQHSLDSFLQVEDSTESNCALDHELIDNISYTDPEIMLTKLEKVNVDKNFDIARMSRIQIIALSLIIYGEQHWKIAEAHVQLANVYLKRKSYYKQVLKHTKIAQDILISGHRGDPSEESEREFLLQNLYFLKGSVDYQIAKYETAENHLMKAKLFSERSANATRKFLIMKIKILSSLALTFSKRNKVGQAIEYIEEAIEVSNRMSASDKYMAVDLHKQIVNIEIKNGNNANISFAIESALKALELSKMYNGKESTETAEIFVLMSQIEILNSTSDFEKIEKYLSNALEIYTSLDNTSKIINTKEMICKLYMKQEKFSLAKSVLKEAVKICADAYGDISIQCAELYDLMGNILFAENRMSTALTYLLKAEETFRGRKRYHDRHSKILKLIEVIKKSQFNSAARNTKGKSTFS